VPLNTAGLNAFAEDGNEAVIWAAIGDGPLTTDQTSSARIQLTSTVAAGVITATGVPYEYTGTPLDGATDVLLYSASAAGTFYGNLDLTGDQAFNAAGEYSLDSLTFTYSAT
jgi:hypothetical protein